MHEAEKSPKPRRVSRFVSKVKRLDVLMLSVYGCTLDEYANRLLAAGYDVGFQRGKKEGYSAGRRKAQGLPPAKAHGHPLGIDKGTRVLMKDQVDRRPKGMTVEAAIKESLERIQIGQAFWEKMQTGGKARGSSEKLPSVKKAKAAYYRDRKKTVPVSSF
jgi:hypothetical protein